MVEPKTPEVISVATGDVVGGRKKGKRLNPKPVYKSKVIKAAHAVLPEGKVRVVGGDTDNFKLDPPSIVIEKDKDKISKIVVRCPCGRHAELRCEYDE